MTSMAVVDGAPGAGKTALICRLLESNKSRLIQASRCRAEPGSGGWTEQVLPFRRGERPAAEAMRRKVLDLYKIDGPRTALGFRRYIVRPGVYVANLIDGSDAGTKSALAQIKRKLRGRW